MTARQLKLSPTGLTGRTGPTKSDRSDQSDQSDQSDRSDGSDIDNLLEGTLAGQLAVSAPLTRRETQILQSILAGQTNKQIARALCRSRRTIEYHRHRLMQKFDAHSAADLIRLSLTGQTKSDRSD